MNTSSTNPPNPRPAPDLLAVALSKLDPAPHGFDWNALMFAAGRASKFRALTFWRIAAAACALIACGFALAYFTRPEVVSERVVFVERTPEKAIEPVSPPAALPAPTGNPAAQPVAKPPEAASPSEATEWVFEAPPEQGVAVRWFTMRNDVLTVGLGVLPDAGRKMSSVPHEGR